MSSHAAHEARPHRRPRAIRGAAMYALLFVTLGAIMGGSAVALVVIPNRPAYRPLPVAVQATPPPTFTPPVAGPAAGNTPSAPPVEISIPTIRVASSLMGLRLANDGSLQVPSDYARAGWFSDGSAPGDTGQPAIIAGHVDSKSGPAVFYRLRDLKPGADIFIRRADGTTARFVVDKLADYSKSTFPTAQVYGATSRPEVRLITCSGGFDAGSGHYLNNLVVFAHEQSGNQAAGG